MEAMHQTRNYNLYPVWYKMQKLFLSQHPSTRERFEKVAQLVEGFESSFGLELLASVHWIMKSENPE